MCLKHLIDLLKLCIENLNFFWYHLIPLELKTSLFLCFPKRGKELSLNFEMKSHFFNSWITSPCSFYAARDMCHPVTVRVPRKQWSRSWHSTITIVSISSLLVTDWMALKSHMLLCLFICLCEDQGNPKSRTFIPLYLRILILVTHTHTLL